MRICVVCSKEIETQFKLKANRMISEEGIRTMKIDKLPVHLYDKDLEKIPADHYICVAIHSLADEPKRFTVHPCGNWNERWEKMDSEINLGGEEKKLSMSSAELLRYLFLSLKKHNNLPEYKVDIEATHHGPNVTKPLLMVEIGSCPGSWENEEASRVIVKAIKETVNQFRPENQPASIVLGGGHYMGKISKLMEEKGLLVSHMCPSSQIHNFTDEMLLEAIEKSKEPVKSAIIDLEGVGQHAKRIMNLLKKQEIKSVFLHEI